MDEILGRINKLLASNGPLCMADVLNLYHDTILEHALLRHPDEACHYTEEFLANAAYLLELDLEDDARIQLDAAKSIIIAAGCHD
jgi:hypothetical protein